MITLSIIIQETGDGISLSTLETADEATLQESLASAQFTTFLVGSMDEIVRALQASQSAPATPPEGDVTLPSAPIGGSPQLS